MRRPARSSIAVHHDLPLIDRNVIALTSLAPGRHEMDTSGRHLHRQRILFPTAARINGGPSDRWASFTNLRAERGVTQATYLPSPEAIEDSRCSRRTSARSMVSRGVCRQYDHARRDEQIPRER